MSGNVTASNDAKQSLSGLPRRLVREDVISEEDALKALADIFARETMKNHISGWSVLVVSDREISSDAHRLKQAQRLTHVQLLFSMSENCFPRTFFRVPCGYVHFLQSPAVDRMDRCICCLRGSFK